MPNVLTEEEKLEWFSRHEGNCPHMYLDTVGVVTVGIGTALFTAGEASALGFVKRGTTDKADGATIELEWGTVKKQTNGKPASFYKQFTQLDLLPAEVSRKFKEHIATFEQKLKSKWLKYSDFPKPAQLALVDMIYNLGSFADFPSFVAAVDKEDWAEASKHCHRKGPSESRNRETKELLENAAKLAETPTDAGLRGVLVRKVGLVYAQMADAMMPVAGPKV
jgi:GH24 family phage-related lysozyme (muramidase)